MQANPTVFTFEDEKRMFDLYVPDSLSAKKPLVMALHGYGDSASSFREFTKMDPIANKYGFAVCYPEASMGPDSLRSWNVGYSNYQVNDMGYLKALVGHLQEKYHFDKKSTFCTGMSNGADMTIQMALLDPDLFRAVAPNVGCLMNWLRDSIAIKGTVPIFMINGTKDDITLWDGDKDYPAIGPNGYMGTPQMLKTFVAMNACGNLPVMDTLANINVRDNSYVVTEKYLNCSGNNQVWLYKIVNGGHDWPGSSGNMDFFASEEIWNFFEQFIEK